MKEFVVNGESVYIDDEVEEGSTGVAIYKEESDDLSNTTEIKVFSDEDKFSDTLTDIFGDNNE